MGSSGAKKAARISAAATREAAEAQAKQSRLQAQAAQQQQEQMINRQKALENARQLQESQKTQEVEVESTTVDEVDTDERGRRRAPREAYRIGRGSSGIKL